MSDRPSDGMDIDELRDEFDWITEFQSRMAERIRGDADVHNLVDYVGKLEAENAKLREQIHWLKQGDILHVLTDQEYIDQCERERLMQVSIDALDKENAKLREQLEGIVGRSFRTADKLACLEAENAKLRELVADMYKAFVHGNCYRWCEFKEPCNYISDGRCQWYDRMRELGVEV